MEEQKAQGRGPGDAPFRKVVPQRGAELCLRLQAAARLEKLCDSVVFPPAICKEQPGEAFGFYVNLGCGSQKCFVAVMLIRFPAEAGALEASLAKRSKKHQLPGGFGEPNPPRVTQPHCVHRARHQHAEPLVQKTDQREIGAPKTKGGTRRSSSKLAPPRWGNTDGAALSQMEGENAQL